MSIDSDTAEWMNAPMGPRAKQSISIRASALPLAFRCAQSIVPPEIAIRETSEPARLGTAVHEALRPLAEGGSIAWGDLPELAERHEVDLDDVQVLCRMGVRLWAQIEKSFPAAETEVTMVAYLPNGGQITGHADALSIVGRVARGCDHKTGRKDYDYSQQMKGYCALVLLTHPDLEEVTFTLTWLRDGSVETYTMTRFVLPEWLEALRTEVMEPEVVQYKPDAHCTYCPRSHECPARRAMVRRDVDAFLEMGPDVNVIKAEDLVRLVRRAKMVAKIAYNVQAYAKSYVEEHGDVVGSDGTRLTIEERTRRDLAPLVAFPVLTEAGFGDEEFADVMKLSISRVESIVAKKAGKGNGASAVRELSARLEELGAIQTKTTKTLQEKR